MVGDNKISGMSFYQVALISPNPLPSHLDEKPDFRNVKPQTLIYKVKWITERGGITQNVKYIIITE